ncbi:questin oxidase family protein, partial [Streptomyces palmae]
PHPSGEAPPALPQVSDTGVLDEALERLHQHGPERLGRLTNHAPMAVEALAAHGMDDTVHRWLDRYHHKLEEFPATTVPISDADWGAALGDPRRVGDWIGYFSRDLAERPWQEVLVQWWPRLLPGIAGGSTHPVIRVGHAVRTLLGGETTAPRLTELAHGLGYWAARHHPLSAAAAPAGTAAPSAALWSVPPVPVQEGGLPDRLAQLDALPAWTASTAALRPAADATQVRQRLADLVAAATFRYAAQAEAEPIMLVHAATAPNAVLRTLPALPTELWQPSLNAAWAAAAAVVAAYAPGPPTGDAAAEGLDGAADGDRGPGTARGAGTGTEAAGDPTALAAEAFARAAENGNEHAIKLTDTALDVARSTGSPLALTAAARACELILPLS